MRTRKNLAALTAVVLAATLVMPVTAATNTITEMTVDGNTEVTANIEDAGEVSYIISIPQAVSFGALTQPDSKDTDHYVFCDFNVTATELNLKSNQGVTVYVKDSAAPAGTFYITQKNAANPFSIFYDVYDTPVNAGNINRYEAINDTAEPGTYGFHLCTFLYDAVGKSQPVTLALNQNVLCDQIISDIAGDYSGTMVFHTALFER